MLLIWATRRWETEVFSVERDSIIFGGGGSRLKVDKKKKSCGTGFLNG